jgi:cob(I)alamin adenosyltransferase
MRIYTKSGDKGETSLVFGERVAKNDPRVEAYGTCDEANSYIGFAISLFGEDEKWDQLKQSLHIIQTKLFHIGAELATPPGKKVGWPILEEDVSFLEKEIDEMDEKLPPLTNFILPGGVSAGAALHIARTVVRRAERSAIQLKEQVNPVTLKYLNRLSDYLFVAARWVNHQAGVKESVLHQE